MAKRGQFNLSFGMIFSIILIIAVIGVASYVLIGFLRVGKCAEISLFYDDLKDEIDKAWKGTIYRDVFVGELPNGVENVCLGDVNLEASSEDDEEIRSFLSRYFRRGENIFLHPSQTACDGSLAAIELEHVDIGEFFCVDVVNKKVEIRMEKDRFDNSVKILKNGA